MPGAWGYARGGMGAVTAALRGAAEAAGARVRLEAPVDRVRCRGRARGRARAGGRRRGPRAGRRLERRPADHGAAGRRRARARLAPGGPGGEGDAAARRPARLPELAGREPWHGAIDIGFTMDDLSAAAADARAGRPAARPWIEAACQTAADDSLAPPGRHVLSMFCQCFPQDVDADAAADSAIARFAEVCPELPDRIIDRLVLGPRELEERFGIAGGHIFHGEMLPGQLLEDRHAARPVRGHRGAVPGRLRRAPGRRRDRGARVSGGEGGAGGPWLGASSRASCRERRSTGCAPSTTWTCGRASCRRRARS